MSSNLYGHLDSFIYSYAHKATRKCLPWRVDFIFYHPKIDAIAIEIDGDEHEANEAVDLERDNSLRSVGIDVIRIKNDEVDQSNHFLWSK